MKSTREKILRTLLSFPGSTINDLADAVGINGISIRHHLTNLEAEDLVTSAEERHGVGRPRLVYSLTDKGVEEFPTSYLLLTKRILTVLGDKMSSDELETIFGQIGIEIVQNYDGNLAGKSFNARLRTLKSLLTEEGFIVEVEKVDQDYILSSLSCPYLKVGQDHPEICAIDSTIVSELLSTHVEKTACMLDGADRCVYHISRNEEVKK